MQRQGIYKCPKCGSADSYEGTTLVNAGGIGVAREIGDSGAYVGASSSSTHERTVRKCRNCGEMLGKKDYVPTASERDKTSKSDEAYFWICVIGFAVLGGIVGCKFDNERPWGQVAFSFWKMVIGLIIGGITGLITYFFIDGSNRDSD